MKTISPEFYIAPDVKNAFEGFYDEEVNQKDVTLWVDPLDGTKGLTEGHNHHVSCMIGVSIKNRPRLGIIHKPFSTFPFPGCGRTYVGIPESGLFTIDLITDSFGEMISTTPKYVPPFENGKIFSSSDF
jgi:3'-phosphoadenosine 5'-phosphosulfate (PAPS) 3'-phosphatase